jgi:hypothetical protein
MFLKFVEPADAAKDHRSSVILPGSGRSAAPIRAGCEIGGFLVKCKSPIYTPSPAGLRYCRKNCALICWYHMIPL